MDWKSLEDACHQCQKCALADSRTKVVFGTGNPQSKVLFIGEAPGEKEDLSGEPFVGRGGKLLDDFLSIIDLDRKRNIYIANMIKCRPPNNRNPLSTEQRSCRGYLENQIALLQPKIIVCLGRVAALSLIRSDFKITEEHGNFQEKDGVEMMALYHPAAILRDPRRKPDTFEDMKKLEAKIRELAPETYDL